MSISGIRSTSTARIASPTARTSPAASASGSNVPLVGYLRETNDRFFLTSTRNGLRLPSYSRLDLRATRTYAVAEGRLSLFVEVINLYNRRNVRARSLRLNQRRMEAFNVTEEMFPILPSIGMMVEF